MTSLRIVCAASVMMLGFAVTASAADRPVAKSTLGSMGFGSMKVLADVEGQVVRGMGTSAQAYGAGIAKIPGASSTNGYSATSSHSGSSYASGTNVSVAGVATNNFVFVVGSAGSSYGKGH